MNPWKLVSIILVVALVATVGVSTYHLWEAEEEEVIIATTTSLKDTKLLDEIAVEYKKETGVNLRFIAKGTGESLKMAKTGDVDMVLVHAPESEKKFLEDGSLVMRKIFAYNFFVIVGPTDDPADISGLDAIGALTAIYDSNQESDDKNDAQWASRGDESGTHLKEKELWRKAGYDYTNVSKPENSWYSNESAGMSVTLDHAYEKEAYTLTDLGTFYKWNSSMKAKDYGILVKASKELLNVYSAMIVSPYKHHINLREAVRFLAYLVSDEGQKLIDEYEVDGKKLFYPAVQLLKDGNETSSDDYTVPEGFSASDIRSWIVEYAYFPDDSGLKTECPPQYRLLEYLETE